MKSIATPFIAQETAPHDRATTLIGTAAFWPTSASEYDASLELVPLIHWLADSIRPHLTVCRLSSAGAAWNGLCEVMRRLESDGRCLLVLPPAEQDDHIAALRRGRAERRCRSLDGAFASLLSWDEPVRPVAVPASSIDLLYFEGLDTPPWSDQAVQDEWIAGLSAHGVLAIEGIHSSAAAALLFERLRKRHPHHAFQIGRGLGLIGAGPHVPSVFREFLSAPGAPSKRTGVDHALARLGQASLDAAFVDRLHERGVVGAGPGSTINASSICSAQAKERDTLHRLVVEQADASRRQADATTEALKLQRQLGDEQVRRHVAQERLEGFERELVLVATQRDDATRRLATAEEALAEQTRINQVLTADIADFRSARVRAEQSAAVRFSEIAFLTRRVLALESQLHAASMKADTPGSETAFASSAATGGGPPAAVTAAATAATTASNTARPSPPPAHRPPARSFATRLRRKLARLMGRPQDKRVANAIRLIREANAFDDDWYCARYPDAVHFDGGEPLLHFLRFGASELRDPSPRFNTRAYVEMYPDVAESGINPLLHYLKFGRHEQRLVRAARA